MARMPGQRVPFDEFIARLVGQPNLGLALAAFLMGLLGNVLASALGGWEIRGISGNMIIVAALVAAVAGLYLAISRRTPGTAFEIREREPEGKAGLILLVGPLDPRARGTKEETERRVEQVIRAADRIKSAAESELSDGDFEPLAGTNLEPALRAVEFHSRAGTLRDCWLIGTEDVTDPEGEVTKGSAEVCRILERWFNRLHPGQRVCFHYTGYTVKPRDYVGLWALVDSIFRDSPYRPQGVICDITGGLKLMSIGAALACLPEGRTMQYMASDRDSKGEPVAKGAVVPILVDIDPYLTWPG